MNIVKKNEIIQKNIMLNKSKISPCLCFGDIALLTRTQIRNCIQVGYELMKQLSIFYFPSFTCHEELLSVSVKIDLYVYF